MQYKVLISVLAVSASLMLAGCGTTKVSDPEISDAYGNQQIDKQMADAATRAVKAQETLARVQIARTTPAPLPLDETNLPEELKRPATIDWSGPAQEAARKIASLVGYQFQITGNPPSVPPSIHISVEDVTAAKALEQIGLQAYPFGEVAVDPNVKRIEFRYLQAQQQPITPTGTSPSWGK
jgi:defect-in-organelle-trafficking protein DotD